MHLQLVVLFDQIIEVSFKLRGNGISLPRLADQSLFLEQVNLSFELGGDDLDV